MASLPPFAAAILTRFPGMRRVRVRALRSASFPLASRPSDFLHSPDGGPGPLPEASGAPATETVWRTRRGQEMREIHRRVLLLRLYSSTSTYRVEGKSLSVVESRLPGAGKLNQMAH